MQGKSGIRFPAPELNQADRREDFLKMYPFGNLVLDDQGSIEEINLAGAALLGVDRKMVLHHPFTEFVVPEEVESWQRCLQHSSQTKEQQGCEILLKRIDGKTFPARLDCLHAHIGGVPMVSVVLTDISIQKRRENRTRDWGNRMAEMREMQIAFQTAVAIAHELNQPLLAIASYSEAALVLLNSDKPELNKITKAIARCEQQAQRAGKSIHELLDFLSIKEVPVEAFDLNKTVGEVVIAARSELELQFESRLILEDRLPPVFANRIHVEKALFNLLRNGIESMHESGVSQPTIKVTVSSRIDECCAQVTIQDNGPGFKEEHLHRMFKPFFTTKPKGVGMGLAVSRSLVEANGGRLWSDPQEGPGATFHMTLPFAS